MVLFTCIYHHGPACVFHIKFWNWKKDYNSQIFFLDSVICWNNQLSTTQVEIEASMFWDQKDTKQVFCQVHAELVLQQQKWLLDKMNGPSSELGFVENLTELWKRHMQIISTKASLKRHISDQQTWRGCWKKKTCVGVKIEEWHLCECMNKRWSNISASYLLMKKIAKSRWNALFKKLVWRFVSGWLCFCTKISGTCHQQKGWIQALEEMIKPRAL